METNKLEEDNASKDLIVYPNHKLGSIVETYTGEVSTMTWIDKAKDKTECSKLQNRARKS